MIVVITLVATVLLIVLVDAVAVTVTRARGYRDEQKDCAAANGETREATVPATPEHWAATSVDAILPKRKSLDRVILKAALDKMG